VADFNRSVDELAMHLEQAEVFVAQKALGDDVAGVEALLKRQAEAEADLHSKAAVVSALQATSDDFGARGVFDADTCRERCVQADSLGVARGNVSRHTRGG